MGLVRRLRERNTAFEVLLLACRSRKPTGLYELLGWTRRPGHLRLVHIKTCKALALLLVTKIGVEDHRPFVAGRRVRCIMLDSVGGCVLGDTLVDLARAGLSVQVGLLLTGLRDGW